MDYSIRLVTGLFFSFVFQGSLAGCPKNYNQYPQIDNIVSLKQLRGVWLDQLSSREVDENFFCTQQANSGINDTSYQTDTTSSVKKLRIPYHASFINVGLPRKKDELVFNLVPNSRTAHWFAGSMFFIVDFRPDNHEYGGQFQVYH